MSPLRLLAASCLILTTADARAYVYIGNPIVTVVATRQQGDLTTAVGHLDFLRVHKCAGGYVDYDVDQTIDFVDGWSWTVAPGDFCGLSLRWASSVEPSNGSWTVDYAEPHTSFAVEGNGPASATLTPFTVVSGTFAGGPPKLVLTIQ